MNKADEASPAMIMFIIVEDEEFILTALKAKIESLGDGLKKLSVPLGTSSEDARKISGSQIVCVQWFEWSAHKRQFAEDEHLDFPTENCKSYIRQKLELEERKDWIFVFIVDLNLVYPGSVRHATADLSPGLELVSFVHQTYENCALRYAVIMCTRWDPTTAAIKVEEGGYIRRKTDQFVLKDPSLDFCLKTNKKLDHAILKALDSVFNAWYDRPRPRELDAFYEALEKSLKPVEPIVVERPKPTEISEFKILSTADNAILEPIISKIKSNQQLKKTLEAISCKASAGNLSSVIDDVFETNDVFIDKEGDAMSKNEYIQAINKKFKGKVIDEVRSEGVDESDAYYLRSDAISAVALFELFLYPLLRGLFLFNGKEITREYMNRAGTCAEGGNILAYLLCKSEDENVNFSSFANTIGSSSMRMITRDLFGSKFGKKEEMILFSEE